MILIIHIITRGFCPNDWCSYTYTYLNITHQDVTSKTNAVWTSSFMLHQKMLTWILVRIIQASRCVSLSNSLVGRIKTITNLVLPRSIQFTRYYVQGKPEKPDTFYTPLTQRLGARAWGRQLYVVRRSKAFSKHGALDSCTFCVCRRVVF
jgi:uncharacterized membrane-anchored protein